MKRAKSRNRKFLAADPTAQDRNSSFDEATGHVRNTEEIADKRKKKGKCPKCGLVKTHKKGVFGLGWTKDTREGEVYKGICLRCNTLYQAKLTLGEAVGTDDRGSILGTMQMRPNVHSPTVADIALAVGGASHEYDHCFSKDDQQHNHPRPSSLRQLDESGGGVSSSRHESSNQNSSNQSSEWSDSNIPPLPPPPLHHYRANSDTDVPVEINQREHFLTRQVSEISIPPEFNDVNNERSSNSSDYLEGILEEEQYGENMPKLGLTSGTSSTSVDLQSRDFTTAPASSPGVSNFDGSSGGLQRATTCTDSPGASAISADDQYEAFRQKKINEAGILQKKSISSSYDESDRRSGDGEEEVSRSGANRATSGDKIYHRKVSEGGQEDSKREVDNEVSTSPGANHTTGRDKIYDRKISREEGKSDVDEDVSTPGAKHDTGKRGSLYERKMSDDRNNRPTTNDDAEDEKVPNESTCLDDVDAKELIDNCTNCIELFDFLKKNPLLSASSLNQALIRIRDLVLVPFETIALRSSCTSDGSDNTKTSLPSNWPMLFFNALSEHSSDEVVQAEGFRTLWTIISTNNHFSSDFMSYAAKKDIFHVMDVHKRSSLLQGYAAGLIACIAATEKYALQFLNANDETVIQRLMNALNQHYDDGDDHYQDGSVQGNVLKALYHLSTASLASSRPMVFFGKKMGLCVGVASTEHEPSLNAVEAVLHAMETLYLKNLSLQISGNKLLYSTFSFNEIDDDDGCNGWISKYLHYVMAAKTFHLNSRPFCESIVRLMSKISEKGVESHDRHVILSIIADFMSSSDSPIVAQHGCRCLYNVCARDSESVSSSQSAVVSIDGIKLIISCMAAFKEHQSIQSEGCLALFAVCTNSSTNKTILLGQGGVESIFSAYQSVGGSKLYEGVGLVTKVRACTALISLALEPAGKIEMKSCGIIDKFVRLLQEDEKIPPQLRCLIDRLLALTSGEEGLLEFRDDASVDETVVCILARLRMITNNDAHDVDAFSLIDNLLWSVRKFSSSRAVQENAFKVLACLYSSSQNQIGVEQKYVDILEAVEVSLRDHQNCHTVVASACSVISNMCTTCLTPPDTELSQMMSDTMDRSILEVVKAMELCIDDISAVEQASGALWALCSAKPSLVVSLGTSDPGKSNTISVLTDAMKTFPSSLELQWNAICVIHSFFVQSDNMIMDERSIACIVNVSSVLSKFIKESESEEAIGTALEVLKVLADELCYDAKIALSKNDEIISAIVSCMFSYPDSLLIQGNACDVIRTLAVDNSKRSQICKQGGTSRVIDSLRRMKTDSNFVYKGLMALENLVSGADVEVLNANDAPRVLSDAIEAHPQSINVQIHGAEVLFHLCSRHDLFKKVLLRLGVARLISEAMTRFLLSCEMQHKGCIVLWSISTQKELKDEVGRYAIAPIIDGLSAHCSPDDLSSYPQGDRQKFYVDAIGATKGLCTITTNKRSFEEKGVVDIICSIIWLHGDNADICKIALSALSNICADRVSSQILRISSDVVDAVVQTMRIHQNKKEVQSFAIILLRNLTFSPTNCLVLQQNKLVSPLVHNAMVNFNTSFERRAEDVLRVMPSLNQ